MSKSSIITEQDLLTNPTPGEILLEEFLRPLDLSQSALARALRVPPRRINEIVQGKRAITADTDLRLARYFGLTPGFFLGLQADHDLMERRRELGPALDLIAPRRVMEARETSRRRRYELDRRWRDAEDRDRPGNLCGDGRRRDSAL